MDCRVARLVPNRRTPYTRGALGIQARLWEFRTHAPRRQVDLDRDPLQKCHFATTKGLTAQTLAPDYAQGRSRQVKAGRGQVRSSQAVSSRVESSQVKSSQVKSSQGRSRQVKAGQGRSSQVRTSIVVSTTTTTTTTTATTCKRC